MDERELIDRIIRKEQDYFKVFVKNHKDNVFNVCYSFLQNYEDAEETAQDVFIEIYYSIHKFNYKSSLKTWIYRIAVNKSIDFLRKKKSKKRFAYFVSIFSQEYESSKKDDIDDNSPETALINIENEKILLDIIEKLPESQRIAITLNSFEEMNHKDIANIMGISIKAVGSLIHRAKVNIKIKLNKKKD